MKKKTMIIHAPEGYEIDESQSTLREIVFKPIKKKLTYDDIVKELFNNKTTWYIDRKGMIVSYMASESNCHDANNCISIKQAEKLLAINKLMNVATYLNNGWTPDWSNKDEAKYLITLNTEKLTLNITMFYSNCAIVYFKTRELAEQAIEILGEDIVRLALSTNW